MALPPTYAPDFWIFGAVDPAFMPRARELGFMGVGYWAADRDGDRIKYYFESPTLARMPWAAHFDSRKSKTTFGYAGLEKQGRGLGEYAAAAHAAGLKVMANMEGVNPYHWEAGRKEWTPELISAVATDLHDDGADRWFTECVAGWPPLFLALAETCRKIGMEYQEGDDPGYLHQWDGEQAGGFVDLRPAANLVSLYHYHYKREEMGKHASLAQMASLGYAFARTWGSPTALVFVVGTNWGEEPEHWEGLLKASFLIRALQFRVRDTMIIREDEQKAEKLDVPGMTRWAQELVAKSAQEQRPLLNVVAHLRRGAGSHWRDLASSGDAITSGAFHAGYDVAASTEPLPEADAYYVYTTGHDEAGTLDLTPEIAALFGTDKPVFLQLGGVVPRGEALTPRWREALAACGLNPEGEWAAADLPAAGTYRGRPVKCTGIYNAYALTERPKGTRLTRPAVTGDVPMEGEGVPLVVGRDRNCFIAANCLRWQMMDPIGDLLAGCGTRATSDVWGIAGEKVTALLAIHDTELDLTLPRLAAGKRLRVRTWDKHFTNTADETTTSEGRYRRPMKQYDFVLIEAE
jgi:hypothetical protein